MRTEITVIRVMTKLNGKLGLHEKNIERENLGKTYVIIPDSVEMKTIKIPPKKCLQIVLS